MKWWHTSMCFVRWDTNLFSYSNESPKLSTCTVIGYSTTTPTNNKIALTNIILQHTSVISEYSASITDSVTDLWHHKIQDVTTLLMRTMYPVTNFRLYLSPA